MSDPGREAPHLIARRRFLRGLGGLTLAIPLLPSLAGEKGDSEAVLAPKPVKRFLFVFTGNGQVRDNWYPSGELSWKGTAGARELALSALPAGGISRVIGPAFDGLRDKLTLIRGLDAPHEHAWGHFPPKTLSGFPGLGHYAVTVDQLMARSTAVYPSQPAVRSLQLLVQGEQPFEEPVSISSLNGQLVPLQGETDPSLVFERLFRSGRTLSGPALDRRRRVADLVGAQLADISRSGRIGLDDRHRLDAHVTHLHELESRLFASAESAAEIAACGGARSPERLAQLEENLPQVTRDHIDVIAAAFRCDLTRVVTLQLSPGTDMRRFMYFGDQKLSQDHHLLSHMSDGTADDELGRANAWYGERVAELMQRLDSDRDAVTGRTVLDDSLVYWGNEFGCNPWHACNSFPVLLGGGAAGAIRTGRYLDYRQHDADLSGLPDDFRRRFTPRGPGLDIPGRLYNQLLVTFLNVMGVTAAEYERTEGGGFGDYDFQFAAYDVPDRRAPLPGLLTESA